VLDFSHGQGWRETETPRNAVNSLLKRIKQPKRGPGFAAMPHSELPSLMAKLRDGEPSAGKLALRFLVLTAARPREVRGAIWAEVDLKTAQWNVLGGRMKAGEPHSVPLSPEALEVLQAIRGLTGGKPDWPIFPGLKGKMLSDATINKALRVAGGGNYTVHGMRSAFRDWVAERTSFPEEWAEAALAHTLPTKVEAAYRRTKYVEQRRMLMDTWADHLAGKSNVVKLANAQ
jgi:integrase